MLDRLYPYRYWVVGGLALLSRLLFVDGSVDWFDSLQYLWRSQTPDLVEALTNGHAPYHPGYILWTWLGVRLFGWTGIEPAWIVGAVTALFGAGALVVFFALAERWAEVTLQPAGVIPDAVANRDPDSRSTGSRVKPGMTDANKLQAAKVATLATLLAGLTPFLWVGSIGILVDPVMIFWYLVSLLLFDQALEQAQSAKRKAQNPAQNPKLLLARRAFDSRFGFTFSALHVALASGLALGLAMLAHTQVAFWVLGFVSVLIIRWPSIHDSCLPAGMARFTIHARCLAALWPIVLGPLLAIAFYAFSLVHGGHDASYRDALEYLVTGNAGDRGPITGELMWRNWRAVAGSTLAVVGIVSLVALTVGSMFRPKEPRVKNQESSKDQGEKSQDSKGNPFALRFFVPSLKLEPLNLESSQRLVWALWLWFLPGLAISSPYLYSNLYGRSSIVAVFPAAVATAWLLLPAQSAKRKTQSQDQATTYAAFSRSLSLYPFRFTFAMLLIVALAWQSLPLVVSYASGPGTFEEQAAATKRLPEGVYAIHDTESVTFRTTTSYDVVGIQTPQQIARSMQREFATGRPVYLGWSSLVFPYAKVDGRNVRIDSTAVSDANHGSQLSYAANLGTLELTQIPTSPLRWATYRLTPTNPTLKDRVERSLELVEASKEQGIVISRWMHSGAPVSGLVVDTFGKTKLFPARFDATDPALQLVRALGWQRPDPLGWSYTDLMGVAELALPLAREDQLGVAAHAAPIITGQSIEGTTSQTVQRDSVERVFATAPSAHFRTKGELLNAVEALPDGTSVAIRIDRVEGDSVEAWLTTFDYQLALGETQEAEDMSLGAHATIIEDQALSGGKGVEFAAHEHSTELFGPYRTLPAGKYAARYHFTVPETPGDDWDLGQLQIAGEQDGTILANLDVATAGAMRQGPIELQFTLEKPTSFIEYRVIPRGAPTPFTLDKLTVIPTQ